MQFMKSFALALIIVLAPLIALAQTPRTRPLDAEVLGHLRDSSVYLLLHIPQTSVHSEDAGWTAGEEFKLALEVVKELAHLNAERLLGEALGNLEVDSLALASIQSELNATSSPRVSVAKVSKAGTFRAMEREEQAGDLDVLLSEITYYLNKNRRELVLEAKVGLWPRQGGLLSLRDARYPGTQGTARFDIGAAVYLNRFRVAIALAEPGAGEAAVALWSANGAARAKAAASEVATILAKLIAKDLGEVRVLPKGGKLPAGQLDFVLAGKRVQVDRLDNGEFWAFASR